MKRLWIRLSCHRITLAVRCTLRGHQWRTSHPTRCLALIDCEVCGQLRGWQRDDTCPRRYTFRRAGFGGPVNGGTT